MEISLLLRQANAIVKVKANYDYLKFPVCFKACCLRKILFYFVSSTSLTMKKYSTFPITQFSYFSHNIIELWRSIKPLPKISTRKTRIGHIAKRIRNVLLINNHSS